MSIKELEEHREFLKGYYDAKNGVEVSFSGKSLGYVRGYKVFSDKITNEIADYELGYYAAMGNEVVSLDGVSKEYVAGYAEARKEFDDLSRSIGRKI